GAYIIILGMFDAKPFTVLSNRQLFFKESVFYTRDTLFNDCTNPSAWKVRISKNDDTACFLCMVDSNERLVVDCGTIRFNCIGSCCTFHSNCIGFSFYNDNFFYVHKNPLSHSVLSPILLRVLTDVQKGIWSIMPRLGLL